MANEALPRIKSVEPKTGFKILIHWDRSANASTVDLSPLIEKGGVFAALRDNENFSKVQIGERNRVIEWPIPKDDNGNPIIEIDAESLLAMWEQQRDSTFLNSIMKAFGTLKQSVLKPAPPVRKRV